MSGDHSPDRISEYSLHRALEAGLENILARQQEFEKTTLATQKDFEKKNSKLLQKCKDSVALLDGQLKNTISKLDGMEKKISDSNHKTNTKLEGMEKKISDLNTKVAGLSLTVNSLFSLSKQIAERLGL